MPKKVMLQYLLSLQRIQSILNTRSKLLKMLSHQDLNDDFRESIMNEYKKLDEVIKNVLIAEAEFICHL
jgi:hypothetical protein